LKLAKRKAIERPVSQHAPPPEKRLNLGRFLSNKDLFLILSFLFHNDIGPIAIKMVQNHYEKQTESGNVKFPVLEKLPYPSLALCAYDTDLEAVLLSEISTFSRTIQDLPTNVKKLARMVN
jgi:hypothetical protein